MKNKIGRKENTSYFVLKDIQVLRNIDQIVRDISIFFLMRKNSLFIVEN